MTDLATKPCIEPLVDQPADDTEIDGELLEEAQRQINAGSPEGAINEALRCLVEEERGKRRAARAELRRMFDEGRFHFDQLDGVDD